MPQITAPIRQSADRLIETLLAILRDLAPAASFACFNLVEPASGHAIVPVPSSSVGGACKATAMACSLRSILDWQILMPSLRHGRCRIVRVGRPRPAPTRRRLWWAGVTATLLCPVSGTAGELTGVVMIVWHGNADAPVGEALADLMEAGEHVGRQIGAVLDLCDQLPGHAPCSVNA
jgi:hypothetical protein